MSLLGLLSSATQPSAATPATASATDEGSAAGGGATTPAVTQTAYTGALMTDAKNLSAGSIIKKALIGGVAGAGAGAGYGLLAGMVSFLPEVTVPMGALIGGAVGAAIGLAKGVYDHVKAKKELAAAAPMIQGAGTSPVDPTALPGQAATTKDSTTYVLGDNNQKIAATQRLLKKLGIYKGKASGSLDATTQAAIKKYEVMKGVQPTGADSPALRQALTLDVRLATKYAS